MKHLTLKQLRYFDALANTRHFGRAADLCAVSQPALSVQIKEFEESLGAPLIERHVRPIALTPLGERIAVHAARILAEAGTLEETARTASGALQGPVRLGVIPTVAPYLLPRVLGALSDAYPNLTVHIRESLTHQLISELQQGRLDAALVALPVSELGLTEFALFDEALVLARPNSQAGEQVPTTEELGKMPLLLLEDGHCFRDQALSFCNMSSGGKTSGLEASALSTLVQLVGAGRGVTFLPEMAVSVERHAAPIDIVRFPDPQPSRRLGIVWRSASVLASQVARMAEVLKTQLSAQAYRSEG